MCVLSVPLNLNGEMMSFVMGVPLNIVRLFYVTLQSTHITSFYLISTHMRLAVTHVHCWSVI